MKDSIALIEVDLRSVGKTRKEWPFLKDRKPDSYKEILHPLDRGGEGIE
jgi:hypothetical protein